MKTKLPLMLLCLGLPIPICATEPADKPDDKTTVSDAAGAAKKPTSAPAPYLFAFVVHEGPQKGLWGYMDRHGNVVIRPQFVHAMTFSDGLGRVRNKGGKRGYVDERGKVVIAMQYDEAMRFRCERALVNIDGNWGCIDKKGKIVIPPKLPDDIRSFWDNLAPVEVGGRWGYMDRDGKMAIKPRFFSAGPFVDGLAPANESGKEVNGQYSLDSLGKWGFINRKGTMQIKAQYSAAWAFSNGLAPVNVGGLTTGFPWAPFDGMIDPMSTLVFDGKWGFINTKGEMVIKPRFVSVGRFSHGLAAVNVGGTTSEHPVARGKWGYIDRRGKMVIKPRFDRAYSFHEGLAAVNLGMTWDKGGDLLAPGRWGFIDTKGKMIIKPTFEAIYMPFTNGLANVLQNWRHVYIDKKGKIVRPRLKRANNDQQKQVVQ